MTHYTALRVPRVLIFEDPSSNAHANSKIRMAVSLEKPQPQMIVLTDVAQACKRIRLGKADVVIITDIADSGSSRVATIAVRSACRVMAFGHFCDHRHAVKRNVLFISRAAIGSPVAIRCVLGELFNEACSRPGSAPFDVYNFMRC